MAAGNKYSSKTIMYENMFYIDWKNNQWSQKNLKYNFKTPVKSAYITEKTQEHLGP